MNRNLRSALIALIALASLGCFLFLAWFLFATPPTPGPAAPDIPVLHIAQLPHTETAPAPAPPPTLAVIPDPPALPPPPWSRGHILDVSKNPDFATLPYTPITLNLENAQPQDALSAFYRALSIPLPANGRGPTFFGARKPVSLHLQEAPLLDALLQFSAQTNAPLRNLTADMLEYGPVITDTSIIGDQSAIGIWCLTGPFAIILDRIDNHISFPAGNPPTSSCTITMTLLVEPGLDILQYPKDLHVDSFIDDRDQPLSLGPNTSSIANRSPSTLRVHLNLSPSRGRRIALFRGSAPFVLLKQAIPFEARLDSMEPITRTISGMKVEFSRKSPLGQALPSCQIRFSKGEMSEDVWKSTSTFLPTLPIQAFGGNTAASPPNGRGGPAQPDGSILLTFNIGRPNTAFPAADRIVINIPTGSRQLNVPFEFKDILLP